MCQVRFDIGQQKATHTGEAHGQCSPVAPVYPNIQESTNL